MRRSSALRAALGRRAFEELTVLVGGDVISVLWDMAKLYDMVQLPVLCEELAKRSYPQELLVPGCIVHAAPNSLRVGNSFGPTVSECSNSILAGDQQSVSWTRGLLWKLMDKLTCVDPENPCWSHVDDLSHVLIGESEGDLRKKWLAAGRHVGSEVARLRLKLSDKSQVRRQRTN